MRFRAALAFSVLAVVLALAAAACGGGGGKKSSDAAAVDGGSIPAGADFIASSALGFATADTDFEGGQWQALDDLSAKFPDRDKLLGRIRAELSKRGLSWDDVERALGEETDVGVLDDDNGVVVTQSGDESTLRTLGQKLGGENEDAWVSAKIGDWTAASDKQSSVDSAVRAHGGSSLADNAAVKEGFAALPADALVRLWLPGKALGQLGQQAAGASATPPVPALGTLSWLGAALQAKDGGVRLSFAAKSTTAGAGIAPYEAELVDEVPSGVLGYLSFRDLARPLREAARDFPSIVAKVEESLGVTLEELAPLFEKEGALYARPGTPLPEVSIVLQVDDERAALSTADRLVPKLGGSIGTAGVPTTTVVDGVTLKVLRGANFAVMWGAFDGKLVISNSTGVVTGLRDGDKLKDDSTFAEARESAEMPDATSGFLYLNLKDIVPLIRNLAGASSSPISEEVLANLEPLRSFLVYATSEGGKTRAAGFLALD